MSAEDPHPSTDQPQHDELRDNGPLLNVWPLLQEAWGLFAAEPLAHLLGMLIVVGVGCLSLGVAVGPLLGGYLRMLEQQRAGQSIVPADVWKGTPSFWAAFAAWFLVACAVFVGGLLLVLPGVVAAVLGGFAPWFVALRDQDSVTAIRSSWQLARSSPGGVLTSLLLLLALNIAGGMVILGVLITAPLGTIFLTLCFYKLEQAMK